MRALFISRPRTLVAIVALIAAGVSLSCADSLLGVRKGGVATLAFAPQFTRENAAIYRGLKDFNLQVNALHLVIKRPNSDVIVKDTTVSIGPNDTVVVLEVQVEISQPEELFNAAIEMKNGTLVLFAGNINVVAKSGANLDQPPVLIPVWVGPGKTATKIVITQADTAIAAGASLPLSARSFDASNVVVSDPDFTSRYVWKVVEASLGSIPSSGGSFAGAGIRGVAHVLVKTPNLLADTVALTLVPPATQLLTVSGGGQTDTAGKQLANPFVVEVRASDNLPVPNVLVKFSTTGGGRVSPDSAFTNAQGRAQTTMTLGPASTSQTFEARAQGITAVASAGATAIIPPRPATLTVVSGDGQTGAGGAQLAQPFVVLVKGSDSLPYRGATVTFAATSGGGSVSPASAVTDAQGHAQTTMTLGSASAAQTFEAAVSGLTSVTVTETATLSRPASLSYASHLAIVDKGSTMPGVPVAKGADGSVIANARITYLSRTASIATVDTAGVVTGVAKGQAVIVAVATEDTTVRDSLLAVVAEPGGPVVLSSLADFRLPLDTTFVVSVYVDMRTSTKKLGSTTIDVTWDPAQLNYVSSANGATVSPTVNTSSTATGTLTLAMADVNGFSGKVELLTITMKTTTTGGTGSLALAAREVNATDYTDLLPITVQVTHPLRTPRTP